MKCRLWQEGCRGRGIVSRLRTEVDNARSQASSRISSGIFCTGVIMTIVRRLLPELLGKISYLAFHHGVIPDWWKSLSTMTALSSDFSRSSSAVRGSRTGLVIFIPAYHRKTVNTVPCQALAFRLPFFTYFFYLGYDPFFFWRDYDNKSHPCPQ